MVDLPTSIGINNLDPVARHFQSAMAEFQWVKLLRMGIGQLSQRRADTAARAEVLVLKPELAWRLQLPRYVWQNQGLVNAFKAQIILFVGRSSGGAFARQRLRGLVADAN